MQKNVNYPRENFDVAITIAGVYSSLKLSINSADEIHISGPVCCCAPIITTNDSLKESFISTHNIFEDGLIDIYCVILIT